MTLVHLSQYPFLPTEHVNPRSRNLDRLSLSSLLRLMSAEDAALVRRVGRANPTIERAIRLLVERIKKGGKLVFIGAGTSGRLGVMEAAECPPTFNTPPSLVRALMAGGRAAVFRSKEGAEDKRREAARMVAKKVDSRDVLIGIAASGVTPFVRAALQAARKKKARTLLITCHPHVGRSLAHIVIAVHSGPEIIAGSTRLKAATATKLVLNRLTVGTMVRLGKVFGNRMVDLQPKSKKLKARAVHLVSLLGNVSPSDATRLLREARGNAKTAILMARRNLSYGDAKDVLRKAGGHLFRAGVTR